MAEVLAPIHSSSSTITMLHNPADAFTSSSANQSHSSSPSRNPQMPRSHIYNAQGQASGYRGPAAVPVAPYAFQSTPHLRQENRAVSAPYGQAATHNNVLAVRHGQGHPSTSSASTVSSSSSSSTSLAGQYAVSKDDSVLSVRQKSGLTSDARPASAVVLSGSTPDLTLPPPTEPATKLSPDRYRRTAQRMNSGQQSPTTTPQAHSAITPVAPPSPISVTLPNVANFYGVNSTPSTPTTPMHTRTNSDDSSIPRGQAEKAKRYRRRSLGNIDPTENAAAPNLAVVAPRPDALRPASQSSRPSFHERTVSSDSRISAGTASRPGSRQSSANTSTPSSRPGSSRQEAVSVATLRPISIPNSPTIVNVPPRASSNLHKSMGNPSPLARPMDFEQENIPAAPLPGRASKAPEPTPAPAPAQTASPAAQRLTELSEKDLNKGMKSRLRRAFSFGSAADMRRASAQNNVSGKLQKGQPPLQTEKEVRDAAIAAQQEAAGIGNSIYSGQGGVFGGSTDNISIQSTASSASIMLRKMGKGMKKGGRSLKGLFRPKSVIGVPAADHAVTMPSVAEVSMVTVEAETHRVNVNSDPHDRTGGGTGYPKLERNSMDGTSSLRSPITSPETRTTVDFASRKSIVGSDRERQEVLNAVKKGILKRTNTNSPPPGIRPDANGSVTPTSSQPTTPADDESRTSAPEINRAAYFESIKTGSTRSLPGGGQPRNISFNQRIQFFDAWSSQEYDRRGEIATCNRLTPMLAQQIKEELNSFKMEMEVHELSKPHTHFF